jgi:hypothetical protein
MKTDIAGHLATADKAKRTLESLLPRGRERPDNVTLNTDQLWDIVTDLDDALDGIKDGLNEIADTIGIVSGT